MCIMYIYVLYIYYVVYVYVYTRASIVGATLIKRGILDFIFIAVLCVCARVHFVFRYILLFLTFKICPYEYDIIMFYTTAEPSPRRSREIDHGRYNNLSFARRAYPRLSGVESGREATRSWWLIF